MSDQIQGKMEVLSGLIIRDLNLEEDNNSVFAHNLEEMKSKLEKIIAYLLDNEFERLLNAMYRLDINETKFKEAFAFNGSQSVSMKITDLIIEREIQKVETRIKYKS